MNFLLLPLSWLYGWITDLRNYLYDKEVLASFRATVNTIGVGNLEVGGTGKTPFVEFLLRQMSDKRVAVLSRGYGRRTRGFVEVLPNSSYKDVGDEMKQVKNKFPSVPIAVCEDRVLGIQLLLQTYPQTEVIILDDAFQHRRLRCDEYILLTAYDRLYTTDSLLPYGRLREKKKYAQRANTIVVTKCPQSLSEREREQIRAGLQLTDSQNLQFATLQYTPLNVMNADATLTPIDLSLFTPMRPLIVTGIAHPHYLLQHFEKQYPFAQLLTFSDHHPFTDTDLEKIIQTAHQCDCVITTEKDAVRLQETDIANRLQKPLCVQSIEIKLLN